MDFTQTVPGMQDFSHVFSDYFRTSTNLESFESTTPMCFNDILDDPEKKSFPQFLTADRKSGHQEFFASTTGVDSALESSSRLFSTSSSDNSILNINSNLTVNIGPVHCIAIPWDDDVNKHPDFASCSSSADSSMSCIPPGGTGCLDFTSFSGNNLGRGSVTENSSLSSGTPTHSSSRRKRKSTPIQRVAANIRERRRMCSLNTSFDRLRRRVPVFPHEKKLSRIQTLRLAIRYISFMSDLMADDRFLLAELSRGGRPNIAHGGIIPAVSNPPDVRTNHNNSDNPLSFQCNSQMNVVPQNVPQSNIELRSKQSSSVCEVPVADHSIDHATTLPKMDISPPPAYNNNNNNNNNNTSTFIGDQCFDLSAMWQPFHNQSLDGGSYQSVGGMFIPAAAEDIGYNNQSLSEMFQSIDDAYDYF